MPELLDLSSLGLLPSGGAKPLQLSVARQLAPDDISALASAPVGSAPSEIAKIGHRHHELAKALAEGKLTQTQIGNLLGFSSSRISILKNDPAFAELVEHYRKVTEAVFVDAQERLKNLGLAAMEELEDRLETKPEEFTKRELLEILGDAFERSVAPSKGPGRGASTGSGNSNLPAAININFIAAKASEPPTIEMIENVALPAK